MADPFSVAAGSFSIADVVLRTGTQVFQFLGAVKYAPKEFECLRGAIHDIICVAECLKSYLEQLRRSVTSTASTSATNLSEALPLFTSAVRSLDRKLSSLAAVAKRY